MNRIHWDKLNNNKIEVQIKVRKYSPAFHILNNVYNTAGTVVYL